MNQNKLIKILAIESSCDETAAAVIGRSRTEGCDNDCPVILSSVVSSQIDLHAKTGGVVPEVASRAHLESIIPVVNEALKSAFSSRQSEKLLTANRELFTDITHIAVTVGPGLIGSLLVGFNTAKSLAYALDIPIIPINHIEGHVYSAFSKSRIFNPESYKLTAESFPILALTVSGGHTSLTLMRSHGVYENIGSTLDDAAGEAFDKVAKLLDLGYPGGPAVSRYAAAFRDKISDTIPNPKSQKPETLKFPRPLLDQDNLNFSFSGLKTAVLYYVQRLTNDDQQLTTDQKEEICFEFEEAVVDVLVGKTLKACEKYQPKAVLLAGGVAANKRLREALSYKLAASDYQLIVPPIGFCGDNAAMIGTAAYYHVLRGDVKRWDEIRVDSNLKL